MSVVIRGMKMPKFCRSCRFSGFGGIRGELNVCMHTGQNQPILSPERMSECPLIELPAQHGRLIDADSLLELCDIMADKCGIGESIWHQFRATVEQTHTIIPAEEVIE